MVNWQGLPASDALLTPLDIPSVFNFSEMVPMDNDWTQIYLYIATKTYRRWGKNEMPGDIAVDSLRDDQVSDLNRLKEWLYQKRTQARLDRDWEERRQKKEEEIAMRKAKQPALFQF